MKRTGVPRSKWQETVRDPGFGIRVAGLDRIRAAPKIPASENINFFRVRARARHGHAAETRPSQTGMN